MNTPDKKKKSLKEKIFHEMVEYWINVAYLSLVFAAFTQYRRFVLAAHDITYTNYGFAVIEALILAKIIMIGDALRLGRNLDQRPLIYSTFFRTVVFSLLVVGFSIIEHAIKGLCHGKGVAGCLDDFFGKGPHELLANSLVLLVAFFPFFAIKELERVLGVEKIRALFFRRRDGDGSGQKES
jgi:hypothetical protein